MKRISSIEDYTMLTEEEQIAELNAELETWENLTKTAGIESFPIDQFKTDGLEHIKNNAKGSFNLKAIFSNIDYFTQRQIEVTKFFVNFITEKVTEADPEEISKPLQGAELEFALDCSQYVIAQIRAEFLGKNVALYDQGNEMKRNLKYFIPKE